MKKFLYISTFILLIVVYGFLSGDKKSSINKTTTDDNYNYISINGIMMWVSNNGKGSHNPLTDRAGLFWPNENGKWTKSAVFEDGLIWAGKIFKDSLEIRAGGNHNKIGLQGGKILDNNLPDDPSKNKYRIFNIIKDWKNLPSEQKLKILNNINEWPVDDGAPWFDINENGIYEPKIDEPKYYGDEVLWFVSNDMDTSRTLNVFPSAHDQMDGSLPLGLEIQTTIWGYKTLNFLNDVVFKKYKIINKSKYTIEEMYLGYWANVDLGFKEDDYAGCDSSINLGFVYNSTPEDLIYESPVPAIGYKLIQGPLVTSVPNDSAKFNDTWRKGYRNLQMTSFLFSVDNMFTFPRDPRLPGDVVYVKPYEVHDILRGRAYGSGFINPFNGSLCYFPLYGDPVSGEGWYEGNGWPGGLAPGNREIMINTGPFNMIPGDTQELVIAIIVAKGGNNLNSITDLKDKANLVQIFYNLFYPYPTGIKYEKPIPEFFSLSQNYPNPFNPVTTIKYAIPVASLVTLKVYDVLGNEICTLVNEEREAGEYSVEFSADGLSSGIYFYTISARAFAGTKKMVVLK